VRFVKLNLLLDKLAIGSIMVSMNKELTDKQHSFLEHLVNQGGDPKKAAELAGYTSGHYQVVKSLKKEILDIAEGILAQSAPKAALKLVEVMNSDVPIPQANMRLQAAQTILDRVGLGRSERIDVSHKAEGGLFILPSKQEVIIDGEYEKA
tara:strand:- start:113 stop:565 length:453 start_codon:yes stop_codon:yes gene_type:complete